MTPFAMPACMGGWCTLRDRCERHLTPMRAHVSERLCGAGNERFYAVSPSPQTIAQAVPVQGEAA